MGDVSKNFDRSEFACRCGCGMDNINQKTVNLLQELRDFYNKPVHINSGCRCPDHNTSVNGASGSKHMQGLAADIHVEDVDPDEIANWLEDKHVDNYGIGRYDTFTHFDTRENKARWDRRTHEIV